MRLRQDRKRLDKIVSEAYRRARIFTRLDEWRVGDLTTCARYRFVCEIVALHDDRAWLHIAEERSATGREIIFEVPVEELCDSNLVFEQIDLIRCENN